MLNECTIKCAGQTLRVGKTLKAASSLSTPLDEGPAFQCLRGMTGPPRQPPLRPTEHTGGLGREGGFPDTEVALLLRQAANRQHTAELPTSKAFGSIFGKGRYRPLCRCRRLHRLGTTGGETLLVNDEIVRGEEGARYRV